MTGVPQHLLLGPRAATTCPRATHNQFDRTVPKLPPPVSLARDRLFESAADHRDDVVRQWRAASRSLVDLRALGGDPAAHVVATLDALSAGWDVVVGGRLPDDVPGGRTGRTDALVRDPAGGYHPCRIARHKVLEPLKGKRAPVRTSPLATPAHSASGPSESTFRPREDDTLHLAHHWRMLEAAGVAAAAPVGALVGTDADGEPPVIAWRDLAEPRFHRVEAGEPVVLSALALYDTEHATRRRIAEVAVVRTGSPDDPAPLVEPRGRKDCESCSWEAVCVETLPADDVSRILRGRLSHDDYATLADRGITSIAELASADPVLIAGPDATEAKLKTWRSARVSAELVRDGLVLRRRPGQRLAVPRNAVEIDVDMEISGQNRVYLWGALVTSQHGGDQDGGDQDGGGQDGGGTGRRGFHPVVDLEVQDAVAERALLEQFLGWLLTEHPAATVYHYSAVERTHVRRILAGSPWPGEHRAQGTSADPTTWVDLLPPVKACLDSRSGHGLKVVATHGAGFHWRDAEPDGWESQVWLEQARTGDTAAARRLLEYNEDDVRATLAVRNWLSNPG